MLGEDEEIQDPNVVPSINVLEKMVTEKPIHQGLCNLPWQISGAIHQA